MRAICLFSGGLDSLAALVWAGKTYGKENVLALYVDLGQKYAGKEIEAVRKITKELGFQYKLAFSLELGSFEKPGGFIPFRNFALLMCAALELGEDGGDIVIQNVQTGETAVGDRTPEFNKVAEEVVNLSVREKASSACINIKAPFTKYTKAGIVRWLLRNGIKEGLIKETVGCFSSGESHCGECSACFRRFCALEFNGIKAKGWFNRDPLKWKGAKEYAYKMLKGEYDERRANETLFVLRKFGVFPGVVVVDLDGVLTKTSERWSDFDKVEPNKENISTLNGLYNKGFGVTIFTSRFPIDRKVTEDWLERNQVQYHRLVFQKPYGNWYVDDKNIKLNEIEEILEYEEQELYEQKMLAAEAEAQAMAEEEERERERQQREEEEQRAYEGGPEEHEGA